VTRAEVPHRTLILAAAAAVLVGALVAWLLAFSSVFGVKSLAVRGTHSVAVATVLEAADISKGTPLIRLDTGSVVRRIDRIPQVASARVQTKYPTTVVITITERVAIGYLQSGTRYALVDKNGAQFSTVSAKPAGLPLFAVPAGAQAVATGQAVATVAAALPRTLLAQTASIQAFDPTAITLLLTGHRVVHWGSAADSARKALLLPTLLTQPGTQFDVSNPALPYTR
jgi:cell division protein FtsQ